MANISYHGSHNGAFVVEDNGEILCVIEVERFLNAKNMGVCVYKTPPQIMITIEEILKWIEKEYGIKEYENCYFSSTDFVGEDFDKNYRIFYTANMIKAKNYIHGKHHESHACGVFYQSPYEKSLIFSFDAGGDDGDFNIYLATKGEDLILLDQLLNPVYNRAHVYYNLGFPYMIFAKYFGDIRYDGLSDGNLVWPGKIMGLVSYGNVIEDWVPHFIEFFKSNPDGANDDYVGKLNILGSKIDVVFDENRLFGQIEYDIAATAQRAFEDCFIEVVKPYLEKYNDLPVCIAGGCALNIILNTRIKNEFNREVFVGPNPNDCGIALGNMLMHIKPTTQIDVTYKGLPILDRDTFAQTIGNYPNIRKLMKQMQCDEDGDDDENAKVNKLITFTF